MTCRSKRPCQPATSGRGAGRPPWGGVFRILVVFCVSYSSPFPVLVAVFMFRRTPLAVPTLPKEWWITVARTAAIDCCSCLSHVRSRRSLRGHSLCRRQLRREQPWASRVGSTNKGYTKSNANLFEPGGGGGGSDVRLRRRLSPCRHTVKHLILGAESMWT